MSASPVNWPWKLSSLTRKVISEEKTHIDFKITKLSKKVTKCAYTFEIYYSSFTGAYCSSFTGTCLSMIWWRWESWWSHMVTFWDSRIVDDPLCPPDHRWWRLVMWTLYSMDLCSALILNALSFEVGFAIRFLHSRQVTFQRRINPILASINSKIHIEDVDISLSFFMTFNFYLSYGFPEIFIKNGLFLAEF